jgi:hypothetical protein
MYVCMCVGCMCEMHAAFGAKCIMIDAHYTIIPLCKVKSPNQLASLFPMAGLAILFNFCSWIGGAGRAGGGRGGLPGALGSPQTRAEVPWVPKTPSFWALIRPPGLDQKLAHSSGRDSPRRATKGPQEGPAIVAKR